ncbi:hypothetical protein APHAL10511_005024 [Amanita phalloides]|nr:hypothetical protein APHAL10511_005024 [Amanita phalloides]
MHRRHLLLTANTAKQSFRCRRLDLLAFASSSALSSSPPSHHVANKYKKSKLVSSSTSNTEDVRREKKSSPNSKMIRTTLQLVGRAAAQPAERHGWHHTKYRRAEEHRLTAAIKSNALLKHQNERKDKRKKDRGLSKGEQWRGKDTAGETRSVAKAQEPSGTKQDFDAEDEGQCFDDVPVIVGYEPGTFVESRRNEISTHGIVVGERHHTGISYCICLMSSGEIWTPQVHDIFFAIPSIVPSDLTSRCGLEFFAENKIQLHARVELLRRIRLVERSLEDMYNVVCSRAHRLYEKLRHPDPEKWSTTTVGEVARLMDEEPSLIMTFAVHKFLMNNPANFVAEPGYETSQRFRVVPLSHLKDFEEIEQWMRIKRGGPLNTFADKARSVIKTNKKRLQEELNRTPSLRPAQHEWNRDDKVILRFLTRALRPNRSSQIDPYAVPTSAILKTLDRDSPILDDHELRVVLVYLGILAPWQDLAVFQPQLDLDLEPEHKSNRAREQTALVQRGFEKVGATAKSPGSRIQGPLGPEDFYPTDPLESVRHDFGDMKMYVIDDVGAEELDDGISIERIPSEPGNLWIHIHITDAASVIPPDHVFAIDARRRQETLYFHNRTWSLFPDSLVHSPRYGLSLGSKRDSGDPLRVITFSCKLDAKSQLLDYKVRAGLMRNIKIVNYDTVDRALGCWSPRSYPFGRLPSMVQENATSLTEEEIEELRTMLTFANAAARQRAELGIAITDETKGSIESLAASLPKDLPVRPTFEPVEFSGFPSMNYVVRRDSETDNGSRRIIAEAAKLACRVASRFGLENGNLPLLHRHVSRFVANSPEDLSKLLEARTPDGYVESYLGFKYVSLTPASTYSLLPKEHFFLGIPDGEGYVRSTSPLRRYSDLMVHWQLHHALLGNRAASHKPPFSSDDVEKYRLELLRYESVTRTLMKMHGKYWTNLFIHRWTEDVGLGRIDPDKSVEGGNPMQRLYGRTINTPMLNMEARSYKVTIQVPTIGVRGALELPHDKKEMEIGTLLNVKLKTLKLGTRPQLMFELNE